VLLALGYARPLYPEVYEAKPEFGIVKLGVVCIYPCPNMMAVVCCGILRLEVEPSMVVRLLIWFTDRAEGFGIDMPPTDGPLVCGLI
jgi:hypothetical protein